MKHIKTQTPTAADNDRVWAEIDLAAIAHNYQVCADYVHAVKPDARAIAVIKADAYGHGAAASVQALYDCGCRSFAVASLEEGIVLREALQDGRDQPTEILVLGYTQPQSAALLAAYSLSQTLISPEYAALLHQNAQESGIKLTVHVKLDTGMHRIGYAAFTEEQAKAAVQDILHLAKHYTSFDLRGLFTHLSDADCGNFCIEQWHRFCAVRDALADLGACPPACHVSNGPASLRFPEMFLDGVRLGAPLYGVTPPMPADIYRSPGCNLFPAGQLRPVMQLKTRIIHLHTADAGEPIGYGALCRTDHPRTIATLSVGYADGWLRAYAGSEVTVHTEKGDFSVPLCGRVCMDLCMADVTNIPCRVGDEVTLFGLSADSLCKLAAHAGTIAYEIPSLITARVPRYYKN